MKSSIKVAIIGGSGLDNPDLLSERQEKYVETPFGKPSDALICGKISGIDIILLARHGRKHDVNPTNVNYRANLWALKEEGATHILATNACGSLREEIKPGHIVIIDQFIDRTTHRVSTFYDGQPNSPKGVCHMMMSHPYNDELRQILIDIAKEFKYPVHDKGTLVVIEGPRFSTFAESHLYRSWNCDLVGMTQVPEAGLAKELAIPYATMCLASDYDCWREGEESVNAEQVVVTMKENAHKAFNILKKAIVAIAERDWTKVNIRMQNELKMAVML